MNFAYQRANGNRWAILFEEGEAILSRYPLINLESTELRPQGGFFRHRIVLHATAITNFEDLDLFVTHLTNRGEKLNFSQSADLEEYVNKHRSNNTIIVGDFNSTPDSPQIRSLSSQWIDVYRAQNPDLNGYTCCIEDLVQGEADPKKRIDYIFL
jgi:endonuclease/exonuclease/phosphatase family metal-dependent hydrolase